jgi:hypothetical protein
MVVFSCTGAELEIHDWREQTMVIKMNTKYRGIHVCSSALVHVEPLYTIYEEIVSHKYSYYFAVHNFPMQWVLHIL